LLRRFFWRSTFESEAKACKYETVQQNNIPEIAACSHVHVQAVFPLSERAAMSEPRVASAEQGFWDIALARPVVVRAARVATIVGIVLATINHGDRLLQGDLDLGVTLKILLTFCVPYSVSTYSSVLAIREFSTSLVSEK
jgi:hypothetical protein